MNTLKKLAAAAHRFIAMCAGGCGTRVPADQVMCEACAWFSHGGSR